MFKYDKLFELMESRGITSYTLTKKQKILSGGTFQNIKNNKNVDTNTLDRLCNYFQCQPWDLIEYIPDEKVS